MALQDLRDFLEQPTLTLPIGGKEYVVQPVMADVWLRLQAMHARAAERAEKLEAHEAAVKAATEAGTEPPAAPVFDMDDPDDSMPQVELWKLVLGDAFGQLAKNVDRTALLQAGTTAYYWQLGNDAFAEFFWQSGGKLLAATEPPPSTSTDTESESTTPKRVSTTTTTSPKKPRPRSKPRPAVAPN